MASTCARIILPVLFAQRLRHDGNLLAALEILEAGRIVEVELELRFVEHVKHDHLVAAEAQRADRLEDGVRLLVEIRDQRRACRVRPKCSAILCSGPLRLPGLRRLQAVEHVQHGFHVLRRRRHVLDDVIVEGDEADAVALPVDEIRQAAGQHLRVFEFRTPCEPNPIDFETSISTEKLAFESASYSLM